MACHRDADMLVTGKEFTVHWIYADKDSPMYEIVASSGLMKHVDHCVGIVGKGFSTFASPDSEGCDRGGSCRGFKHWVHERAAPSAAVNVKISI